ncbi:hypothetical protein KQX54_007672 [Cotesia glomerata]|uniref:Uncharacterized protein n=1 Tax=Cotesia glomerata TaxID=32391 RepID=A0AAV7J5L1_COTGL|nr:hypothetical protein KQX54_007672 [Cotesia glomerata]
MYGMPLCSSPIPLFSQAPDQNESLDVLEDNGRYKHTRTNPAAGSFARKVVSGTPHDSCLVFVDAVTELHWIGSPN